MQASRRERNREAQQQFRKRRQAAEAARVQRLKRLEGVVERMSTVIVDFADKMLQEEVLKQYPALAADVQDVITQVLVLANEAGDLEETRSNERHKEKSPDYADDDSDTRRCSQDSASPSGSQNLPIGMPFSFDQQDMFITSSPPEHSQLKETPQIVYPAIQNQRFYSHSPYLPSSSIMHSLGSGIWSTPKSISPTTISTPLIQSRFNTGSRHSDQAALAHRFPSQTNLPYPSPYYDSISKTL
ncbi:hypothetical protein FOYG_15746 [Fusarium oxysporum NRRL 32931]|uniref:BZIP domain-containing protein n=1 Tax=Fusarium oxysporum NRRL 32931 TaxID=660029 RepID=W9HG36_FUSOX|nr:hypothetical protein FOYG_15746 [Fusarium oxysporum NRRL 32931]